MGWQYFILWLISFAAITYLLVKALQKKTFPPRNDDEGGTPIDTNLPKYDPPSGSSLDDLLTDRPPKGWYSKKPDKPLKY